MIDIISIGAVIAYFVPLVIVLIKKLWRDQFFMLFAAYWALGGVVNLADVIPGFPKKWSYDIGVYYNMLDVPFILSILYLTTSSAFVRRFMPFMIVLLFICEVIGIALQGVKYDSLKYPLGAGIVLVLGMVVMEIVRYMQTIEHSNRQNAKMFVYAAVLFQWATFVVIYISDYFIFPEANNNDGFIIYYLSTMVAILIASCGYLLFRKYEQQQNHIAY